MRRRVTLLATGLIMASFLFTGNVKAQEEASSPFDVGVDLYSSYVWRGSYIHGASLQPWASVTIGSLEIGAWGAYEISPASSVPAEADLYISYGFDFGLSLGLTDYYYPGGAGWFETSDSLGTHAFEINLGYEISGLSISANYVLNEAAYAASAGGDMYFELGYGFDNFNVFLGAGDGWHTSDTEFGICNIGIGTSKEIAVSESFSLPISGAIILNPEKETFHITVGLSF
jgi:hypothetical protein